RRGRGGARGRGARGSAGAAPRRASARALVAALEPLARRHTHLVLSVSGGKDAEALCRVLAPCADRVTLTRADALKSLDPVGLAPLLRALAPELDVRVVPNPHLALRAAREAAAPEDLVCATGSVYLAGVAREVLRDPAPPPAQGAPPP